MERDWSDFDGVEVIPGKVSGVPVLKHSRVPADLVADAALKILFDQNEPRPLARFLKKHLGGKNSETWIS